MKLDHVLLITKNFEKLTQWYIENLGFKTTKEWAIDLLPNYRVAYLEKTGLKIEIAGNGPIVKDGAFGKDLLEDHRIPGYRHIGVKVDNIDKLAKELSDKGIGAPFPPMDVPQAGIRAFLITDCDGNTIEFIQPL